MFPTIPIFTEAHANLKRMGEAAQKQLERNAAVQAEKDRLFACARKADTHCEGCDHLLYFAERHPYGEGYAVERWTECHGDMDECAYVDAHLLDFLENEQ